jgi:hypothetical protein
LNNLLFIIKLNIYDRELFCIRNSIKLGKKNIKIALIKKFVESEPLKKGVIIEYTYNMDNDTFIPYRLRTDKDKPNGEITVTNTLKNIQESIKIEEL